MYPILLRSAVLAFAVLPLISSAATRYVSQFGSHTAPFLSWETAATNIQSAIGATTVGDIVLVTNGVYATGGFRSASTVAQPNRVAITNAITVRSVNGPEVTVIQGAWNPGSTNGTGSVRCAYLASGATLDGFTLTNGSTLGSHGAGVFCAASSVITNCIIVGNVAQGQGGGVYGGIVRNSRIEDNLASGSGGGSSTSQLIGCIVRSNVSGAYGGGAYAYLQADPFINCAFIRNRAKQGGGIYVVSNGKVRSCTIVQNAADSAGGVYGGTVISSIVYYNSAAFSPNYASSFSDSCTTPLPSGSSNISTRPNLLSDMIHLDADSICIGRGLPVGVGEDIDGSTWNSPSSIGCDEWSPVPIALAESLRALPAEAAGDVVLSYPIAGATPFCQWSKDGVVLLNEGHYENVGSPELLVKGFGPSDAGVYQVVATNAYGAVTSAVMRINVACVDVRSAAPSAPYASWQTAASSIQDAVDASLGTTVVLVTNGVYSEGGRSMPGYGASRVVLDRPVTLVSVGGPAQTLITGVWDPAITNGPASVRCVWLGADAFIGGFTLSNGSTTNHGGGILSTHSPFEAQVYGCVITNCSAKADGGGVHGAWLVDCVLANNHAAAGGGIASGTAIGSALTGNSASNGAGAHKSFLDSCQVIGNFGAGVYGGEVTRSFIATNSGVGVMTANAENCRIVGNTGSGAVSSLVWGSLLKANLQYGSDACTNLNCTIVANAIAVRSSRSTNCVFAYNATIGDAWFVSNCILQPGMNPPGTNWFLSHNLQSDMEHIAVSSACVGRGIAHGSAKFDIDGEPYANPPAIGCDEWSPNIRIAAQPRVVPGDLPGEAVLFFDLVGNPVQCRWTKNGVWLEANGHYDAVASNRLRVRNFGPLDTGDYQVVASNDFGAVTSSVVHVKVACVDPNSPNPTAPFSTWHTAATTVQAAVDAADVHTVILVTNGVYASGSRAVGNDTPNRLVVDKPITLISASGAEHTIIEGAWDPVSTNGLGSVRCAWLSSEAIMGGFTFRNGSSQTNGGGVWMSRAGPTINLAQCMVTNCSSAESGGGVYGGYVVDSTIMSNSAKTGGGTARSTLKRCLVRLNKAARGGGVYDGVTQGSWIHENTASVEGGGMFLGNTLVASSSIAYNTAPRCAGVTGDAKSTLYHCTIISNTAWASRVAGAEFVQLYNSIVYYNSGADDPVYGERFANIGGSTGYSYVCSPFPTNQIFGYVTNTPPQLLDITHLTSTSPCIEAGAALGNVGFNDIDGEPWRSKPSMGCDEFSPSGLVGPISVNVVGWSRVAAGGILPLAAIIEGRASEIKWDFGDGVITNQVGYNPSHVWSSPGSYVVTATVFNNDQPNGVSASLPVHVVPLEVPQFASFQKTSNSVEMGFSSQPGVTYEVYATTNLANSASWQLLKTLYSIEDVTSFKDSNGPADSRFYRLKVK